jgi:hypothetical protein
MRGRNFRKSWQPARGKNQAHWDILTLDDLPKSNGKYCLLIAQLKAQYKADKEFDNDKHNKNS